MKLYISPCPNDTFIFEGLINKQIDIHGVDLKVDYHDIAQLNELAASEKPHFVKVSAAALPILYKDYRISHAGSALGWGNGPLVVRRAGSCGELRRVAVPGMTTTAALLLGRYFPSVEEFMPMLFSDIAIAVARGEVDGGVLIHEGRFTYQSGNLELVADLGAMWESELHTPLPLGLILIRRDIEPSVAELFQQLIRDSLRWAQSRSERCSDFILGHAQEIEQSVVEQHITLFVNDFSMDLGAKGVSAIESLVGIDSKRFI